MQPRALHVLYIHVCVSVVEKSIYDGRTLGSTSLWGTNFLQSTPLIAFRTASIYNIDYSPKTVHTKQKAYWTNTNKNTCFMGSVKRRLRTPRPSLISPGYLIFIPRVSVLESFYSEVSSLNLEGDGSTLMINSSTDCKRMRFSVVPIPSHTIQVLSSCGMQKQKGRPGPFCHVNDVSVYVHCRQTEGERSPIERTRLRPVCDPSAGGSNIHYVKNAPLLA